MKKKCIKSNQQPQAKEFRKHCYNVMFHHVQQQLTNKMKEDYQQATEEQNNQVQAIHYKNVILQAQRDMYQAQLQRCQDQIRGLIINRHVLHANDPGKDNIVMTIEKNTTHEEDEIYEYLYYIARIQRRFISTKRQWFRA